MSETVEAPESHDLGDDAANAFFANIEPEAKVAPKASEASPEEPEEEPEGDAAEPEETEEEAKEEAEADPDDAEVELKLGETTQKAKLRDLKEAYAKLQETNTKSLEAQARLAKVAEQEAKATLALTKASEKAEARWAPYAKLDFLALSRDPTIDQATFQALRTEAQEALNDVKFFREELDGQLGAQRQAQQAATQEVAKATLAALSNPETGIKGWGPQLYGEMIAYAEANGAPKGHPQTMVAEWALRALHKAYLYDKGVTATKAKVEKVIAKPTRVLSSGTAASQGSAKADSLKSAMQRLKAGGTTEDAADAFFASMTADD